jgi:hypothetical protein
VEVLKQWFDEHNDNPYTSKEEKKELMIQTGLSKKQVTNWFICERARRHDAAKCSYSGEAVAYLHDWYEPHESHPFPTEEEKMEIAAATELNEAQIDVWLESERVRRGDAKKTHRLPLSSIKVLKEWLELHEHHPIQTKKKRPRSQLLLVSVNSKSTIIFHVKDTRKAEQSPINVHIRNHLLLFSNIGLIVTRTFKI